MILIAVILVAFAAGAYRIQRQANQIAEIIDAQSPLVFAFTTPSTTEPGQTITLIVVCTRTERSQDTRYSCTTERATR